MQIFYQSLKDSLCLIIFDEDFIGVVNFLFLSWQPITDHVQIMLHSRWLPHHLTLNPVDCYCVRGYDEKLTFQNEGKFYIAWSQINSQNKDNVSRVTLRNNFSIDKIVMERFDYQAPSIYYPFLGIRLRSNIIMMPVFNPQNM